MNSLMTPSAHWAGFTGTQDVENFRNNGGSAGLDGRSRVGGEPAPMDIGMGHFAVLLDIVGDELLSRIYRDTEVGNPSARGRYGKYMITRSDTANAFNAWRLSQYLENGQSIIEIGPGYGCLAAMLRRLFPDSKITLIDLPNQRAIQQYYLDRTVGLDGFEWVEPEDVGAADVVINLRSFMEMTTEQVAGYFDLIQNRIKPRWFYCGNRYAKLTRIKEYPFADDWTARVSKPLWPENSCHEFLLERGGSGFRQHLADLPPHFIRVNDQEGEIMPRLILMEYCQVLEHAQ